MGNAYHRARELCQQIEETPQLFIVLWGLWQFHIVRAEYKTARELAEQLLHLAQSRQDSDLLIQAYYALGLTSIFLGEFVAARECFEQGVVLYDPQLHSSHTFLYGYDPKVGSLFFVAWTLCYLGYPEQALSKLRQALALAQDLSHPFTTASVLSVALWVYQLLRHEKEAREQAEILISLCNEQGFTLFFAWGTIMQGWALAEQGQREEGIVQMSRGLAAHQATGAEMGQGRYLALLAEAHWQQKHTKEGLSALAEALEFVHQTGERNYEAELYRIKGQLVLQSVGQSPESEVTNSLASNVQSPESEAEDCFVRAIESAQKQQAKSLELRAATSLARLWQQQGKTEQAHKLLSEIYNWFTEGFATKDLQEAKTLLAELA
jgi:predicted ATPase